MAQLGFIRYTKKFKPDAGDSFSLINSDDVPSAMRGRKSNAVGSNLITMEMVKLCYLVILKFLVHIFNCYLKIGHFSVSWMRSIKLVRIP